MRRPPYASAASAADVDAGFTLVELIITIVIMGAITVPLGNLVISYFTNTATTQARLAGSHDAQIAAAYFAQDVASMGSHASGTSSGLWVTPFGGGPACGNVAGGTRVLALASDDYTSVSQPFNATAIPHVTYVAYVAIPVGAQYELHRIRCAGAAATGGVDTTVMHNLAAIPGTPTCGTTTCDSTSTYPSQVTINTVIKDVSSTGSTYPITLSGQRRQT
jgi:prepilin-type N-terminal cleavage/methylation domain-containing protein